MGIETNHSSDCGDDVQNIRHNWTGAILPISDLIISLPY